MKGRIEKLFNEMVAKFHALVRANHAMAKQEVVTMADVEMLVAAAEDIAKQAGHAAGLIEGLEAGKLEAQTRATEILEACAMAGMEVAAIGYVKDTTFSVEQVRIKLIEAQAAAAGVGKTEANPAATVPVGD